MGKIEILIEQTCNDGHHIIGNINANVFEVMVACADLLVKTEMGVPPEYRAKFRHDFLNILNEERNSQMGGDHNET